MFQIFVPLSSGIYSSCLELLVCVCLFFLVLIIIFLFFFIINFFVVVVASEFDVDAAALGLFVISLTFIGVHK